MYYTHNLQFESAAAMFAGNLAQARAAAQRTVKLADPIADQMVMIEPFAAQELTVLVRFGQWPAILETKPPAPTRVLQSALYHFAHGAALAATGKAAEAEADLAALKAAAAQAAEGRDGRRRRIPPPTSPPWRSPISTARIAEAKGDTAAAIKGFTAAVALEDKLGYNEPPDWLNPERERLGAVLLKAGRHRRRREGVPRRSGEEHRQSALALRPVSRARGAEEGRRRRDQGVVRQGLGRRRRDARR